MLFLQQQKLKPDVEVERVLDQYSLRSRREEKKKEEIYAEKKIFETIKTMEKPSSKTKELEFGGRFGMCARSSCLWILLADSRTMLVLSSL